MKNLTYIFIITLTAIQTTFAQTVYPVNETNGTSASCKSCKVINPSKAVGTDMGDYSTIKVQGSPKNVSYTYQNLSFITIANAGTEINFVISNDEMDVLNNADIQNIRFYTLLNNVSNKDSIAGDKTTIAQIDNSGKYLVTFTAKNTFNAVGIQMNTRDNKEEEKNLRIYGAYYNVIILPVQLLSFKGKNETSGNVLEWVTLSEENNSGFIIEKSADGKDFTEISSVSGQGTTKNITEYSYTDIAARGLVYYRLQQKDFNGVVTYTQVISVNSTIAAGLTMMGANPFENSVTAGFTTSAEVEVTISIVDMKGSIVYQQSGKSTDGYNQVNIEGLNDLQPGVYTMVVIAGNNTMSARIIK